MFLIRGTVLHKQSHLGTLAKIIRMDIDILLDRMYLY